jgi:hypothetical protein
MTEKLERYNVVEEPPVDPNQLYCLSEDVAELERKLEQARQLLELEGMGID